FGTILAVSHAKSKRKAGLLWAANMTGIDVEIPDQPAWTDEDLASIRVGKHKWVNRGSALAWLGHLNALKKFLSTPHETALILEDDADWDIALRSSEVPLAAAALRHLFDTASTAPSSPEPQQYQHQHHMHTHHHSYPSPQRTTPLTSSTDPNYWGPTGSWEILHLGHSDSEQYDRENGATLARIHSNPSTTFPDASLPGEERINPATKTLLYSLAVPLTSRLWHRSHWPLGSYAYGITRAAAQRIVDLYSAGSTGSTSADAFDVVLLELCRDHDWKCWTLEPGLIGEYYTPSEIALANMPEADREKAAVEEIYDTWNLRCAVRQRALWVEEGDEGGRQGMIDRVRRGECPADDEVVEVVGSG
ncbi:glycosyltransferase family 25 protein, partial [Periconia macrospinosa]